MSQVANGLSNATGPLHDLSDYHFTDGRATQETNTQRIWRIKREAEQSRRQRLEREMVELHLKWQARDLEKNNDVKVKSRE